MTGYQMAATILGTFLALLFLLYARARRNDARKEKAESDFQKLSGAEPHPSGTEPDFISRAAGGIFKAHKILNSILAIVIVAVVLLDAIFDSVTRLVVLSTVCVMLLIVLFWRVWPHRK